MRPAVRRRAARAVLVAWLALMWVLLWGTLTAGSVVAGLLVACVVVVAFPPGPADDAGIVVRPLRLLGLLGWFAGALVITNLRVAREVLVPRSRSRIRTAIVAVPLRARSDLVVTVVANLITLTPGTLTIDVRGRPAVLYVHVLSLVDAPRTCAEVGSIERRVVAAIGSRADRELVLGRGPSSEVAT